MPQAVYIHIPFCNRICPYCDFNKYVLKGQPVQDYLHALKQEMKRTYERFPTDSIKTIFVGGGTPTVLTADQLGYFLESVQAHFPLADLKEYTFEANPETIDQDKLRVLREFGVNRLSYGVQTFDRDLLRRLGRMHSPEDVFSSIQLARKVGFDNISIDLMFGLPKQTVDMLNASLDVAFQLDVTHVSAYSLKVEEGTFFHTLEQKGKLPLPSEEEEVRMYNDLMDRMSQQGFEQYEISNFARPGFQSIHNLTYWRNNEYYGLGAGAHGYVHGLRHVNAAGVGEYIAMLQEQKLPIIESHKVEGTEAQEDMMMMGLRTKEGVSSLEFSKRYQKKIEDVYGNELQNLLSKELIEKTERGYRLTRKGMFLGNEVFAEFLHTQ